jgi:hypothetical protein
MRPVFNFLIFLNWDFDLEISHLRKKVFVLTSKMLIRTLYVKRFRSSDLFVFSTQRGCFLAAAATPNKHMVAFFIYKKSKVEFLTFYFILQF